MLLYFASYRFRTDRSDCRGLLCLVCFAGNSGFLRERWPYTRGMCSVKARELRQLRSRESLFWGGKHPWSGDVLAGGRHILIVLRKITS